jgi:hypothetical protein
MINKRFWIVWWIVTVVAAAGCLASEMDDEQWEYMQEPPRDSAEAQDRRVWLAQEQPDTCLMEVNILDSTGTVVRHLLSRRLHPHYCNAYWDCRDDSGRWVPAGSYTYVTNDCGGKRTGHLRADYKPYEISSFLHLGKLADSGIIAFDIPADSLHVSLGFYDRTGTLIFAPIRDSVMMAGRHERKITHIRRYVGGVNTLVRLQVEDATIVQRFRIDP